MATALLQARLNRGVADGQLSLRTDTAALATYFNSVVVGMAVAAQDGAGTSRLLAVAEFAIDALQVGASKPGPA